MLRSALLLLASLAILRAAPQQQGAAAKLAQSIRETGLDPDQCFRVRDLSYYREDIKVYFHEGYLIFSKPVQGERLSAVFSADVESGDGEVLLFPPQKAERQSMAKFTQSPNLDEHFSDALFIFSDNTAKDLYERITQEGAGKLAPEMGPLLADKWNFTVKNILENFDLRLVADLMRGGDRVRENSGKGFLFLAVAGKKLGNFDVIHDPNMQEEVLVGQISGNKSGAQYDVWTQFPSRASRSKTRSSHHADFTTRKFKIETAISGDLKLRASVSASIHLGPDPLGILPFEVSRAIHVSSAKVDGKPAELMFRDSLRERATRPDENDAFLVALTEPLAPNSDHVVEFEEDGSVITSAGKNVYFVQARSNWYPQYGVGFAEYDMTFRHPRTMNLVASGELRSHVDEGEMSTTRYVTPVPIRVAGFNLGEYEKVSQSGPGFNIDVYGNRHLEYALVPKARDPFQVPNPPAGFRLNRPPVPSGSIAPPAPTAPDPLGRLREVAVDAAACFQYFSAMFGTPAINTLTIAPVPGSFGQGFPGLVYLSTIAYIEPTERPNSTRGSREQTFFSDMIQAHEIAHQWWGNIVVPAGYQDEWIVEGLSNYSALMWMEKKKGPKAMEATLTQYRDDLVTKDENGKPFESAGPISWGYRIESSGSGVAWRVITYEKGAWIFHMLRKRMGDERFLQMLVQLRRRYEFQTVSTENLLALVKEFLPPRVSKSSVDLFFDSWVYSTGVPVLKMNYAVTGAAGRWKVAGKVEQSGVDADFSTEVPIELQFAQGPAQTVWVETGDDPSSFEVTLAQLPTKVNLGLGTTVLASRK